jgi:hypothetical protein
MQTFNYFFSKAINVSISIPQSLLLVFEMYTEIDRRTEILNYAYEYKLSGCV